jgi:hypothetical protein
MRLQAVTQVGADDLDAEGQAVGPTAPSKPGRSGSQMMIAQRFCLSRPRFWWSMRTYNVICTAG